MVSSRVLWCLFWVWVVVGCAPQSQVPPQTPAQPEAAPTIRVPRLIVTAAGSERVDALLQEAYALEAAGRFADAQLRFEQVYDVDPRGRLAPEALFHSASCHDEAGKFAPSLEHYVEFYRRFPQHELASLALVRSARLFLFLEKWARAGEVADILLARVDGLPDLARVATYSAKALALLATEDDERAAYFVEKGRQVLEALNLDAAGKIPRDAAALYFALGEVRRLRADRIHFKPVPKDFARVLEQRCQLLLDAQSAYSSAMRAYDAHWSAMAGYRVGELYQALHRDLMQVPAPSTATDLRKRQLFEGAMRLRYSVLLSKAQTMMQHTVAMAERTGEASDWVQRARASGRQLDENLREERAAIDRLGYTRGELQAALDRLAAKGDPQP